MANPDSALYTKDLAGGFSGMIWTYFGLVCNGLVRYALGINRRYSTRRWLDIEGMKQIYMDGEYTAEDLKLCDVLYANDWWRPENPRGKSHVALITDIIRETTDGQIKFIEVSEAIRPHCVRRIFSVEDYFKQYGDYTICRYDYVDSCPECDLKVTELLRQDTTKMLPAIAVDYGNKSNYDMDEEVVISVFKEGKDSVEIIRNGKVIETVEVDGYTKLIRKFDRGYYVLKCKNTGDFVEFCVKKPEIEYEIKDGFITINAKKHDEESRISHMDFRSDGPKSGSLVKMHELTDEEKETGVFKREIPSEAYTFKVYFENKYGVWTHSMIRIKPSKYC